MDKKYTFDDILLVPAYSDIERGDVNIISMLFDWKMIIPVLSSPMDTITGRNMLETMWQYGAVGVHHRYCDIDILSKVSTDIISGGFAVSPSMGIDEVLDNFHPNSILVLDVSHGNTKRNLDFCKHLVMQGRKVISGNIANKESALRYLDIGVNYLRVGIGSGSVCLTRIVTGVGYPQASAIQEINELKWTHPNLRIVSDGGHKNTGDIIKALALGADFVMLGGMIAGTEEVPEKGKNNYRGMASEDALSTRKKEFFVEGLSKEIEPKGSVKHILKNIKDAIEQACYYVGARNLQELREAEIIYLSDGAMRESYVR